ncbi:lipopolysaccharide biosynthesis protein [Pseudorhodoferax sp. Leaf265]|uniref:lipopolysaccharide biosynthesis protein n=1 Tax=Pseudorhodoferax sp. Leaf265 TaxID=1736315 RepID=UPI0006F8E1D7|nr:lipopolysaccharide biosynthesis protein [Pseudorhodoferax sp. Leaf265]KQP21179.1 hypothetical protein ASF45_03060 [Pseudorhodoferax sp. Leaf265]
MKAAPHPNLSEIKKQSVRGAVSTVGARAVIVLFSLASTAVLARLLAPGDFGVLAMVMSVVGFVGVFKDFGLSAAAVQAAGTLTPVQASNLFWMNLAVGAALTLGTAAAAPLVGMVFGEPALVPVTMCVALSFVLISLGGQHAASLQRELRFKRKAFADVSGALVGAGLSILLAWKNLSYWSLVWGTLASAAVTSVLLVWLAPLRIQRPQRGHGLRRLMGFGGNVTAFETINYFHRNLDNVLIGRVWGADALGLYSRAYQLLMFPITNLRAPITAVAFPAMSRLRNQPEQFRAYYRKVSFLLALASMPLVAFLAVAAEEAIGLLLGPHWHAAVPIFQALAFAAFIQPVASLRGIVTLSSGRSRDYLLLGTVNAVIVCIAFVAGLRWGPIGVAIGYSVAIYLALYPTFILAFRTTKIRVLDFWATVAQPAVTSLIAAAAVQIVVRPALPSDLNAIGALGVLGVCFGAIWLLGNAIWPGGWTAIRNVRALFSTSRP